MAAKSVTLPEIRKHMGAGFVRFKRITPVRKELKSEGGVLLPDKSASGEYDHAHTIFGQVTDCGLAASRTNCEPFPPDVQTLMGFPLKPGTYIVCRNASYHRIDGNEDVLNTWDVIEAFDPRTPPDWAPKTEGAR